MCQCAQRRAVIVQAATALVASDASRLAPAAAFVGRTLAQDASAALAAARARLAGARPGAAR